MSKGSRYRKYSKILGPIFALLLALMVGVQPVFAHHSELEGSAVCEDDGTYTVTVTVTSWNPGHDNGVNNSVRLDKKEDNGSWQEDVDTGAFTYDNGFEFVYIETGVSGDLEDLDYRAVTLVAWGPNEDINEPGQVNYVDVELDPSPCKEPIQVICAIADVDGNRGEWDVTEEPEESSDFVAYMYRAGKPDKTIESWLYLRYDADNETLYVLVKLNDKDENPTLVQSPEDAYVKVVELGNNTQVDGNSGDDGTPPDFRWTQDGYEASLTLSEGVWTINVHLEVNDDGENQTSAVEDRELRIKLGPCEPSTGTLTIEKTWIRDDSGTEQDGPAAFKINAMDAEAGIKYTLPAGQYQLSELPIEGYTPSDWDGDCAADGTITLAVGQDAVCSITNDDDEDEGYVYGHKFLDLNADMEQSGEGEVDLSGWMIQLKDLEDNVLLEKVTDENGKVSFKYFYGDYKICEVLDSDHEGWLNTTPLCQNVTIPIGKPPYTIHFGNRYTLGDVVVIKFYDTNKDDVHDEGEAVLEDWEIKIYKIEDLLTPIGTAKTDVEGKVEFNKLPEGDYRVCEKLKPDDDNGEWRASNGTCRDITVVGGEVTTARIGNYQFKPPTALPQMPQPNQFGLFLPFGAK